MPLVAVGTSFEGPRKEMFEVTDFLGHGAFGEVYRAVGRVSGTVVAVKSLPGGIPASDGRWIALLNEVRAAQRVTHPNVVHLLYVSDGTASPIGPYIVMEYVSGGTLARFLRAQAQAGTQVPLVRSVEMLIDIAQGARAINQQIVHRDIKPDNILLEDGQLKIGDFGISKFADESTRLLTFKGGQHPAYMAPEGWQNYANTFKLDVYSAGLVYYDILTLKHPLANKVPDPNSHGDWQKAHLFCACPDVRDLRPEVPLAIAQLLSRMVAKRPDDRPPWDETLKILSQPEQPIGTSQVSVTAAVGAAVAKIQKEQEARLAAEQQQHEQKMEREIYGYSCRALLERFNPLVADFNQQFQHGQIRVSQDAGTTIYDIPTGRSIQVSFFEPRKSGIRIRNGELIGGGWIGLPRGRSANLVLLKYGPDDLYGKWMVYEIGLMALANPNKLIGQFGITRDTVLPFGFRSGDFYDQMQWAAGGMHVFTYNPVE